MTSPKILLTIIVLLLVVGTAVWLQQPQPAPPAPVIVQPAQPEPTPPPAAKPPPPPPQAVTQATRLRFTPQAGQTLAFRFETVANSYIDFAFIRPAIGGLGGQTLTPQQSAKTPVTIQASGELYLKYYVDKLEHTAAPAAVATEDEWQVAAIFADLSYRLNDQVPSYSRALTQPFTFRMKNTGFISEFRFSKGIPKEAEQFTQHFLYTLQTALPEATQAQWNTKELDMSGRYRAAYTLTAIDTDHAVLAKQKRDYFTLKAAEHEINPLLSRARMDIGESRATIEIPLHGAWLLAFSLDENTRSVADGYVWAEQTNQVTAQRVERDLSEAFPANLTDFLAQLDAAAFLVDKYYLTDPELDRLGAHLNLEKALNLFEQLKNAEVINAARNAEKFLVNYLRQYPKVAFELVDVLDADPRRKRLDQSTHLVLWRLLTEAGHAEAQQAMVGVLNDPNRSHVTQMRALAYVSNFEYPQASTVDALWVFHSSLIATQDKASSEYKIMSLFALGSLGNAAKLNDGVKPTIGRLLNDSLQAAVTPREQAVALGAVSNYGDAAMLETIQPYFQAEHYQVRAAAYNALRHMDDPRALETLTTHYATETSPKVRAAATQTLSKMSPSPASIAWAEQTVLGDDAPKAQIPLVEVLGKNLTEYPDSATTLRALLETNPDNQVKREIYKYIVPGQ